MRFVVRSAVFADRHRQGSETQGQVLDFINVPEGSRPVKLLIYSHTFAPSVGGVETIVMTLARGLVARTADAARSPVEVTVATPTPARAFDDAVLSFRIIRQPSVWQLWTLIRQADVVHLAGPALLPLVLSTVLRKRVFIEHHGFQAVCPNGQLLYEPSGSECPGYFMLAQRGKCLGCTSGAGSLQSCRMLVLTFFRRWLCMTAFSNITPTSYLAGILKLPRMVTIHHGLPIPRQGLPPASAGGPPRFAYVGRLVSTKGVYVLLAAAEQLRARGASFRLDIIGDGPERPRLETETSAAGLSDHVRFQGYLSDPEAENVLAEATAVIVPSLAGEVFGLAALENMARGKLVIASGLGSLRELIGDTGLTFPQGDAAALADCMTAASEQTDIATSLASRARDRAVQCFDELRMVESHRSLYEQSSGTTHPCGLDTKTLPERGCQHRE